VEAQVSGTITTLQIYALCSVDVDIDVASLPSHTPTLCTHLKVCHIFYFPFPPSHRRLTFRNQCTTARLSHTCSSRTPYTTCFRERCGCLWLVAGATICQPPAFFRLLHDGGCGDSDRCLTRRLGKEACASAEACGWRNGLTESLKMCNCATILIIS
jgi:hypothetical protein